MGCPVPRRWSPGHAVAARVLAILVLLLPARAAVCVAAPPRNVVQAYLPFNDHDLALGIEYLYRPSHRTWLGPFACIGIRPDHEVVKDRLRPRFAVLYREVRYHGGAGLQATAPVGRRFQVHAGVGGAYSFGDYAGTSRAAAAGWSPLLRAGVGWESASRKALIQVSYQYADLKTGGSNWCVWRVGFAF